ncbi:MAG: Bax inhibitor-1/YccA family protein [Spirochaetaceae bacterium]|jgi:FtsH-binding integral membrane protein|nr:Bax inhibitor-1/YccA family protein [Spirochaetaceae bacterium]
MFNGDLDSYMKNATESVNTRSLDMQKRFITGTYLWMAAALSITGITAVFCVNTNIFAYIFSSWLAVVVLVVAEFGLVWFISARINSLSASTASLLFFVYSTLNGLTMSIIFVVYTQESIAAVFFISAGMFAGMCALGFITKTDLTKMGNILIMALWGIIISSLVNLFLHSSGLQWLVSFVSVIVFSGLAAWDAQKLKNISVSSSGELRTKASIIGALALYLDFINLFLALLNLFGRRK